ncbi:hypothetical protein Tdes44962_MAKER05062 [Teratosphaeria destructans]|uniref:Uncharacterized protein n=1 Tax=Teratosphaeria destructans TaxID=418781 RepID=A0A9W7SKY8_9PEZI|nr:hypothetical protein Tdes44962_MAKER05062 [Teratosphaeria destructans]
MFGEAQKKVRREMGPIRPPTNGAILGVHDDVFSWSSAAAAPPFVSGGSSGAAWAMTCSN